MVNVRSLKHPPRDQQKDPIQIRPERWQKTMTLGDVVALNYSYGETESLLEE